MAIEIRLLGPNETDVLENVASEVFDHTVYLQLSAELLSDDRHHHAVALDDGTVVGMASAVDYVHPDKPAELWINEVGVAPAYRRAGVGQRLLQALFDLGRHLGWREVWVATEPDNVGAGKFYAALGGKPEASVIYTFKLSDDDGSRR